MKTVGLFALLFAVTAALECGLAALLFRNRRVLYAVFLCNLLTNPAMNLLLGLLVYRWGPAAYWWGLGVLEAAVAVAEAAVLRALCRWDWKKALPVSLLLNGLSCGVGLLGNWLL